MTAQQRRRQTHPLVMSSVRIFLLIFFAAAPGFADAQLLDNSRGLAFTDVPFFNTEFIKTNKIREIRGAYTFKKQGDVMRQTNYVYIFTFDLQGRLERHYQTAKGDGGVDTIVRFYTYDNLNHLRSSRESEKTGFITRYYTYDDQGRTITEEIWRDIDTLNSQLQPEIERSLLWNTETMKYKTYNGQLKKKVFNSNGNQYLETTSTYDSLGYLKAVEDLYIITRARTITKYTYQDRGWIDKVEVFHNNNPVPVNETRFTYDQFGNLKTKLVYKNGVFTTEYAVIYSPDTGLLSSVIIRDVSTNFMSIIRFSEAVFLD